MKTVPLHGKKAAGRVAVVDDEDYELVMQYRWFVYERPGTATRRPEGPYAIANAGHGRAGQHSIRMHWLIVGAKGIDHEDHYGLNNQRSNLRPATQSQNGGNQRSQLRGESPYKGVTWSRRKRKWLVQITAAGRTRHLGYFWSEMEAAYAYDAAARELFGKFAHPNFPGEPPQALRDEWATIALRNEREPGAAAAVWWAQREPETYSCAVCGGAYRSRSPRPTRYCGESCRGKARYQREHH